MSFIGKVQVHIMFHLYLTHAKRPPEIHLFFHGLSNYDSHFIIQGCVHFKDSYQFLLESLAILVQNLMDKGPDHFVYINKFIKDDEQ